MRVSWITGLLAVVGTLSGCADKVASCSGVASVEGVAHATPVIAAFSDHIKEKSGNTALDRYFGDIRHYEMMITTSESTFEYEFIPQRDGNGFKGGGATYTVDRKSGEIIHTKYML